VSGIRTNPCRKSELVVKHKPPKTDIVVDSIEVNTSHIDREWVVFVLAWKRARLERNAIVILTELHRLVIKREAELRVFLPFTLVGH
jgi:hypothetical protein